MRKLLIITVLFFSCTKSYAQQTELIDSLANTPKVLEEFELLNLCHCIEYLEISNLKINPIFLKNNKNMLLARYNSLRLHNSYYDTLYQYSYFFKKGVSAYFEKQFNYSRLDSLYYKPIFDYYINETYRIEGKNSKKGMPDHNSFFDCFYKLKEIPLQEELNKFLILNKKILFDVETE